MIKFISAVLMTTMLGGVSAPTTQCVVDSVEDNVVAIEVDYGVMRYVSADDFNNIPKESSILMTSTVSGTITNEVELLNGEKAYQFKSYDNEVWWLITEKDIIRDDVVLRVGGENTITYFDNGTTKEDYKCYGEPCENKEDCECYVYDDILLDIR